MLELSAVREIEKSMRSDGIGTLQFGRLPIYGTSVALDPLDRKGVPAFVDIADAELVYHIILDAKEKAAAGQAAAAGFGFSR